MQLKEIDTSKFLFDPNDVTVADQLEKYEEFCTKLPGLPKVKIVQYIICMYDIASQEIRSEFPLYPQRKYEIAKMLGMVSDSKKIPQAIEDVLIGKNKDVNAMIIKYLTLFNNPDILMLASYYEMYVELNKTAFSGSFNKDTIAGIEKVNSAIKELTDNVFMGKDETELRRELYKSIDEQSLGIRPEEIAEKLQSGEKIFEDFNPYAENYEVDPLKFMGDR